MSIENEAKRMIKVMTRNQRKNTLEDAFTKGKIISVNPLIIDVQGLALNENDLDINKYLLAWDEEVIISDSYDSYSRTIHHPSKLHVGDYVGLYGLNPDSNTAKGTYQKYILEYVLK